MALIDSGSSLLHMPIEEFEKIINYLDKIDVKCNEKMGF